MTPEQIMAEEVRKIRRAARISLRELSDQVKVPIPQLSKMEHGHIPMPPGLPTQCIDAMRWIARERALAIGAIRDPRAQSEPEPNNTPPAGTE